MQRELLGIHHITAITADAQRNVDFYTDILGLRLVKLTVNFDDPSSYHLYYGDVRGRPGTILTFFAHLGAAQGRPGPGQATIVAFTVPLAGLRHWAERLEDYKIAYEGPIARFDDRLLTFFDPDGVQIELVGRREVEAASLPEVAGYTAPVPDEYAVQRVAGVTVAAADKEPVAAFLTDALGFIETGRAENRTRYVTGGNGGDGFVDVLAMPGQMPGQVAAGSIHHVAWRTPDDAQQVAWRAALSHRGHAVTPIMDRAYFHSIYFREPGGVLFEIATDPPGFTVDEPVEALGARLQLPSWYEDQRAAIEAALPPLRLPQPPRSRASRSDPTERVPTEEKG
jgi:glyoxalase family protein